MGDYSEAEASELEEPISADKILSYKDKYMDGGKKTGGSKGMSSLKERYRLKFLKKQLRK